MTVLNSAEVSALHAALDDEYQAWSTYSQVIADFGEARPFINIRDAEARHIEALAVLFERYGIPLPANDWPGRVPRYATLDEACAAGVEAEIANGALYEHLLAATDRADILVVFRNLQAASQERHLPAFRRCAARGGGGGRRPGGLGPGLRRGGGGRGAGGCGARGLR